jgi:hypothetical protein
MEQLSERGNIAKAARACVGAAFGVLAELNVIPTSSYHRFVWVGRDYEGMPVMQLPEFKTLEGLLNRAYPARFGEPRTSARPEFANMYILNFIEACVRRCADEERFEADADGVTESATELITLLDAPTHTIAAVRAVSHIATQGVTALTINGIEIVPERPGQNFDFFLAEFRRRIPGSGGAFNRERPSVFGHPHAVLAATATTEDADIFDTAKAVSRRLDRFMLVLRLLTGTTARTHFEVRGPTTLVGAIHPELIRYQPNMAMLMVRRTARLQSWDERPIQELGALIDAVELKRERLAAASFDIALGRFNGSFATDAILALVDLATALEAIFIDEKDGTEGLTVRLRTRAAALLATDDDPAASIFNDIGAFYDLRSTLVHGGNLTEARLRKKILGISTISEQSMFGIATAQAVDRMRDLVRRAILARLCLATGTEPIWPFDPKTSMEVAFTDDARRHQMRQHWHATLDHIGAASSWQHLPAPGDIVREDYGPATRSASASPTLDAPPPSVREA